MAYQRSGVIVLRPGGRLLVIVHQLVTMLQLLQCSFHGRHVSIVRVRGMAGSLCHDLIRELQQPAAPLSI